LLTESLMLALMGSGLGLWIAYGGIRFIRTLEIPSDPPIALSPQLDGRVLLFSLIAAILSALVFGLAPALQSLRAELVPALKASSAGMTAGGRRTIGRNILVVAQIALTMVLLVATGMLIDGFRHTLVMNPGFSAEHRLMMEFNTALVRDTPEQSRDFYEKLVQQGKTVAGIKSVTLARSIPFMPDQYMVSVAPEGYQMPKGQETESMFANIVDENYFDTMKSEIVEGRAFTADDKESSRRVAIVNEEFAKDYWPKQEALGKRFRMNDANGPWVEVVGVAKTSKYLFVGEQPTKFAYLPFAQNRVSQMLLIAQAEGDAAAMATPLRRVVQGIDANQPVFNVRTLSNFYQLRAIAVPLMILEWVGAMGLAGLTLALVGLYGLIAYSVSRRTQEIGVRMAIGASKGDVLKMVLREGLWLSGIGIVVGGIAALLASRLLAAGLVGLAMMNVATFVVVPILLIGVTMVACYVPARRASMVDPMVALHYE
jgi:putative ABC transport system permease protein